jgi:hypothetical protein
MNNTLDLIQAIINKDSVATETAFNAAMAERVSVNIDALRTTVAQNMFTQQATVSEKNLDEKNWIAGAIKHPGAETHAAAKAGESTHDYMEKHKHSPGKAGKRARLGLTLSKLNKK